MLKYLISFKPKNIGFLGLLSSAVGTTTLPTCKNCSVSWLYRDIKKYGQNVYENLLGSSNVICPEYGPIVSNTNEDFIDLMESCYTPCTKVICSIIN